MDMLYAGSSLVAVGRLVLWAAVVFVLVPRLLFRDKGDPERQQSFFAGVMQMMFAGIVAVNLLLLLHVFDQYSLMASMAATYVARAVLVNHISVRVVAAATWRRAVMLSLDAVEAVGDARQFAQGRRRLVAAWLAARRPRGAALLFVLSTSAVVGSYLAILMVDVVMHPASDLEGYLGSLEQLKALAVSRPLAGTEGAVYLLEVVRRASNVDPALLLRVVPALLAVSTMATVMWATQRLKAGRAGALLAGMLFSVLGVTGMLPVAVGAGPAPLSVAAGMLALLPTLVHAIELSAGGRGRWLLVVQGSFAAAFLWSTGGLLLLAVTLIGLVAVSAVPAHRASTRDVASSLGSVASGVVLGLGASLTLQLIGGSAPTGALELLRRLLGTADALAPGTPPSRIAVAATVCAVLGGVLVLLPDAAHDWPVARRAVGLALVAVSLWSSPAAFGLPTLVSAQAVGEVAGVLFCIAAGLVFNLSRTGALHLWGSSQWGRGGPWLAGVARTGAFEIGTCMTVASLALLALGPVDVIRGQRVQSDSVVSALYRVAADLPPYQWTVVSARTEQAQVTGFGQFMDRTYFLATYDPVGWRFDPRSPELAVPTPYLVVLLTRDTPSEQSEKITAWFTTFATLHRDQELVVTHPAPDLTMFQIHRPPELDEQVFEGIRKELSVFSAPPAVAPG